MPRRHPGEGTVNIFHETRGSLMHVEWGKAEDLEQAGPGSGDEQRQSPASLSPRVRGPFENGIGSKISLAGPSRFRPDGIVAEDRRRAK